ncbi:MAG: hypothetical protein AAF676_14830 [Pseudomonadota bacterium]
MFDFRRSIRAAAGAFSAAIMLSAGSAAAQDPSAGLPRASVDRWTAERLTPNEPPFINGAIAQVRGRGEGRFAILCRRGQRRGLMAYLPPRNIRDGMLRSRETLNVTFTFDDGSTIKRRLQLTDPPFWTGNFGPRSRIARKMKSELRVTLDARNHPGVESTYTLNRSWASIEQMFALCRR